eukprot:TRINITY_DN9702_c0_g1_i2.p1 TRINITY_DN9702_c0_g1~~TRINITY_DN9702_c0_g1_i2.p1  ORF type:complete len:202 (+),score=10.52 TRINITY_DN9702_c0_g1_i2:487-1092(+)
MSLRVVDTNGCSELPENGPHRLKYDYCSNDCKSKSLLQSNTSTQAQTPTTAPTTTPARTTEASLREPSNFDIKFTLAAPTEVMIVNFGTEEVDLTGWNIFDTASYHPTKVALKFGLDACSSTIPQTMAPGEGIRFGISSSDSCKINNPQSTILTIWQLKDDYDRLISEIQYNGVSDYKVRCLQDADSDTYRLVDNTECQWF